MGLEISKHGKLYRVWSTITDSWRTPPTNRLGAMRYLYSRRLYHYKLETIELYLAFPHHFTLKARKGSKYIAAPKRYATYDAWYQKNYLDEDAIEEMYQEAVAALEREPE